MARLPCYLVWLRCRKVTKCLYSNSWLHRVQGQLIEVDVLQALNLLYNKLSCLFLLFLSAFCKKLLKLLDALDASLKELVTLIRL